MKQGFNQSYARSYSMWGASAAAGAIIALVSASQLSAQSAERPRANQAISIEGVMPRVRIINFDQGLARFDASDGSIAKFSGNLDNASAQSTWIENVKGVSHSSGLMEIQQPGGVGNFADATFLVDVVTGDTWLLRRRATNATWEPVK